MFGVSKSNKGFVPKRPRAEQATLLVAPRETPGIGADKCSAMLLLELWKDLWSNPVCCFLGLTDWGLAWRLALNAIRLTLIARARRYNVCVVYARFSDLIIFLIVLYSILMSVIPWN